MTEIAYDSVSGAVETAGVVREQGLDVVTPTDDPEKPLIEYAWVSTIGDPVNSIVQVMADDEDTAKERMTAAAWEILENRRAAAEAALTPHNPSEEYSNEQFTGFSRAALKADDPVAYHLEHDAEPVEG